MSTASKATEVVNQEELIRGPMNGTTRTGSVGDDSPFEPTVWGDFFVDYTPPISQMSVQCMREKSEQLQRDVRRMFEAGSDMSVAETVTLVDALERLGIDSHFQQEIDVALSRVHCQNTDFGSSNELHIVALRFRLLRQHGFWISPDVFDKFRDGTGNFILDLNSDPRGLLSLYNAAFMALPDEDVLHEAITFTEYHLEAMKGQFISPLREQITRALDIPLPRYMHKLETMHYINEYEQEDTHNATLLELSRLDYNITRSTHLKELRAICIWWKELYESIKLTYARDRAVEMYFWSLGPFPGEGNSPARIMYCKVIALVSLMDDTYDVHATFAECKKLHQAMQRWDESAVSILPEYLHMMYVKILNTFNELEDTLEPDEKYRVCYVRKEYISLSKYYLQEAKWCHENYLPSFSDQLALSSLSSSIPVLTLAALMAAGDKATREALEWARDVPDMIHACGEIGRLLNDIAAYKRGKNKMDVASSLECYMKEFSTTGDEAAAALRAMADHAWKRMNRACLEIDRTLLPAMKMAVIQLAGTMEVVYNGGNDGYTFSGDLESLVTALFLKPVPI